MIVFLQAATNNKALTVFQWFQSAVQTYGLPSRVRTDKGGENVEVAWFMLQSNQVKRTPLDYINGSIIPKFNPLVVLNNVFTFEMFESNFDC